MLPPEIIANILSHCDGTTLCIARNVNKDWRDIIDYHLTKHTKTWKYCCYEEIPEEQLIAYLNKICSSSGNEKYKYIYDNWLAWQNISHNIHFDSSELSPYNSGITAVATIGRYTAVGSKDGTLGIYDSDWHLLNAPRYKRESVTDIKFLNDGRDLCDSSSLPFVIALYKCNCLALIDFNDIDRSWPYMIENIKLYSVGGNRVCWVNMDGRIGIFELLKDSDGEKQAFVTYVRIHSIDVVSGVLIRNGIYTFLMNSDHRTLRSDYSNQPNVSIIELLNSDHDILPVASDRDKIILQFYFQNIRIGHAYRIYRSDIVISLTENSSNQILELYTLEPYEKYHKTCHTWEVSESSITCIQLYGNTFLLGDDAGDVYLYSIDSWDTFDIRKYSKKVNIVKEPIISIDVIEKEHERIFVIGSSYTLSRLIGLALPKTC